jgi:hypothetical protein
MMRKLLSLNHYAIERGSLACEPTLHKAPELGRRREVRSSNVGADSRNPDVLCMCATPPGFACFRAGFGEMGGLTRMRQMGKLN